MRILRTAMSPPARSVEQVMLGLRRIVRALRVSARAIERSVELTSAQLFVLQQLADGPALSVKDIAARTLTDQSSVSVVVAKLVAAGLVTRRASPDDARRAELALSPRGRKVLQAAPEPAQARLVQALAALTEDERGELARLLDRVATAMGPAAAHPDLFFEDHGQATSQEPSS